MIRKCLIAVAILWPATLFAATELQKFTDVRLVENPSNDGDSFVVQGGERQMHLRLYFVDCPESVATTDADAKRVRDQARYFGITDAKKIFQFGHEAERFTREALSNSFTVYTAFSGALGRSPGGRIYAFVVTNDGKDLGQLLVANGLGRAYGSKRSGPRDENPVELQATLVALESQAMLHHLGAWAATDSSVIDKLRAEQRAEDAEIKSLIKESSGKHTPATAINLNTASPRELQAISGIGPVLASKIIAGRPYGCVDDLLNVSGVGPRLLRRIRPYLTVELPP